jgi:hypothetical protein
VITVRPILFGAVLALLWLAFGLPLAPVASVLAAAVQPVTIAFAAGVLACPYVSRWRWTR